MAAVPLYAHVELAPHGPSPTRHRLGGSVMIVDVVAIVVVVSGVRVVVAVDDTFRIHLRLITDVPNST
jgi:hypothetical protein